MVYKKYIKRDGKLYGPYIYQSKRVGGKVVSEYCGTENKLNYKKIAVFAFGIFAVIVLIAFLFNSKGSFTGNAILNSQYANSITENVQQNLSISLKEGELIPSSSKIIFKTDNIDYEYSLSSLIIDETPVKGKYYIEGETLSGSGDGYGLKGEETVYPTVSFTLILKKEDKESEEVTEEVVQEQTVEEDSQPTEETSITEQEQVIETPAIEETEEPIASTEEGIVSTILDSVSNFFLGMGLTGKVTDNPNLIEIKGETSFDKPFIYTLKKGETVELLSGSVKTDLNLLDDNVITFAFSGDDVVVTTDYSEVKEGFGESYIGTKEKLIYLDIPSDVKGKEAVISLFYGEDNLPLNQGKLEQAEESNIEEEPVTIPVPKTEKVSKLTEYERNILVSKFGDLSVKTTNSELKNGRYLVRYEFGGYFISYSYDANLSQENLEYQMEKDRSKWLRDIIQELSEEESVPESAEQFNNTFSI